MDRNARSWVAWPWPSGRNGRYGRSCGRTHRPFTTETRSFRCSRGAEGVAVHLNQFVVVHAQRGQLPAPHAAGVQTDDVGTNHQPERRPMSEHDGFILDGPARNVKPGHQATLAVGRILV